VGDVCFVLMSGVRAARFCAWPLKLHTFMTDSCSAINLIY
jgi:hypothetical protein